MRQLRLYIARDEDGDLNIFCTKPKCNKEEKTRKKFWVTIFYGKLPLSPNLYPELTFEKSPQPISNLEFMHNFPREREL